MRGLAGYQGYVDRMDRSSGKSVTIAFFDTEEPERSRADVRREIPKQLGDLIGPVGVPPDGRRALRGGGRRALAIPESWRHRGHGPQKRCLARP
jgi:hypothetical protein